MKIHRILVVLTVVNLGLLVFLLVWGVGPALESADEPVLRGRALEIVDDQGRVRASLSVLPAGTSENGDAYAETVLLRLITERGRPSVKLAASEEASGASFVGPTGTKNTYVIVEAGDATASVTVKNEDGAEQIVEP